VEVALLEVSSAAVSLFNLFVALLVPIGLRKAFVDFVLVDGVAATTADFSVEVRTISLQVLLGVATGGFVLLVFNLDGVVRLSCTKDVLDERIMPLSTAVLVFLFLVVSSL
jgi:hypothetical protein